MVVLSAAGCSQEFNLTNEPGQQDPWVIRTDFSSDDQWKAVRALIAAPQSDMGGEFFAYVRYIDNKAYRDVEPHDLVRSLPDDYPAFFCFAVDRECIEGADHPVLVIGFYPSDNASFNRSPRDTPAGDVVTFRALPSQIQGIQNNLSIGNMDFEEFADHADEDGVFRGFPH